MITKYARSIRRFATGWLVLVLLVAIVMTTQAWDGTSSSPITYYGDGLLPLTTTVDGVNSLNIRGTGGSITTLIIGRGGDEVHYPLTDHLGSTRITLGLGGGTEMSHEYGPYGTTAVASARNLYAGHPYDPSRGLYETPARDYEPTSGRFLAVDLGRQDASPYVYAGNDPVGYLDVTGDVRVPYFMKSGYPDRKKYMARSVAELFGIHSKQTIRDTQTFRPNKTGYSNADHNPRRLLYGDAKAPGDREFEFNDLFFWVMSAPEEMPDKMPKALGKIRGVESSFARKFIILDFTNGHEVGNTQRALEAGGESVLRIESRVIYGTTHGGEQFAKKFIVGDRELKPRKFRSYVDREMFKKWPSRDVIIPRWMLKPRDEGATLDISDTPTPESLMIRQVLTGWPRSPSPPESPSLELPVSIPLRGLPGLRTEESWPSLPSPPTLPTPD